MNDYCMPNARLRAFCFISFSLHNNVLRCELLSSPFLQSRALYELARAAVTKCHTLGGFRHRHAWSHSSGANGLGPAGSFWGCEGRPCVRSPSLTYRWPPFPGSSRDLPCACVCVLTFTLWSHQPREILWPHFNPVTSLKPFSADMITLRNWRLGLKYLNFFWGWGNHNSVHHRH